MNDNISKFIKTSMLGGLIVIIPVAILIGIFGWLFGLVKAIINPATLFIMSHSDFQEAFAFFMAASVVVVICFSVGAFVRTGIGKFFHGTIEKALLLRVPFYSTIKEIIMQFLDTNKQPFSKVALVSIFGNETLMTAFVTDETTIGDSVHSCERIYTVFVPTGPNPTSGNIYHLPENCVKIVDVSVESAMKSIISCGSGSSPLLENK